MRSLLHISASAVAIHQGQATSNWSLGEPGAWGVLSAPGGGSGSNVVRLPRSLPDAGEVGSPTRLLAASPDTVN